MYVMIYIVIAIISNRTWGIPHLVRVANKKGVSGYEVSSNIFFVIRENRQYLHKSSDNSGYAWYRSIYILQNINSIT
jgi:hypothetical protein